MRTFYHALLRLYPAAYRCEFGDEMMDVLSDVQGEIRKKNAMQRIFCAMREMGGLLGGALQEHLRSITGSYHTGIFSVRRFAMKSEFRFPKATVGLMLVILAVIMFAIEKAKAISASVPHANPPVGPIHSMQATIVQTLLAVLIWAIAAGAIGWGILYALRRSGVQQLSEMNPPLGQRASK
ncbi:MAG TPA: hypothetical protein VF748_06310 [Candidatus Acidoferrum sp.]